MTLINKIDFQGDDLFIYYNMRGDSDKHIKNRIVIVSWKKNPEIVHLLQKMFQCVIAKYVSDFEKIEIDWSGFIAEMKKYEESQNDHS